MWEAVTRTVSVPVSAGTRRHMQASGSFARHIRISQHPPQGLTEKTSNRDQRSGFSRRRPACHRPSSCVRAGYANLPGGPVRGGPRPYKTGPSVAVMARGDPGVRPRRPTTVNPTRPLPRRVHVLLLCARSSSLASTSMTSSPDRSGPAPGPRPSPPCASGPRDPNPSRCAASMRSSTRHSVGIQATSATSFLPVGQHRDARGAVRAVRPFEASAEPDGGVLLASAGKEQHARPAEAPVTR